LKKSTHFAFTASISALWANAGAISPVNTATTSAVLRMTNDSHLTLNICALQDFPQDRRKEGDSFLVMHGSLPGSTTHGWQVFAWHELPSGRDGR
jgi:hypothetical protein